MTMRHKRNIEELIGQRFGNRIILCEVERERNAIGQKVRMVKCKNVFNGTIQIAQLGSVLSCGKSKHPKDMRTISSGETISEIRIGQKVRCKYGIGTIVKEKMNSCILEMADGVETFRCISKKELMEV